MADPTSVIQQNKDNRTIYGTGTQYTMPSDLQNAPYYTKITFVRYNRNYASSNVTETATGTIMLPIPTRLAEQYNLQYNGMSLGIWGGASQVPTIVNVARNASVADMASQAWRSGKSMASELANGDFDALSKHSLWQKSMALMPKSWQDTQPGAALTQLAGAVPNPHMTAIFEGVQLRTHSFEWHFSPRSQQESQTLKQIEQFIKIHSHPSYTQGTFTFALDYPDQVYLDWMGTSDYLEPVKKSVVTGIQLEKAENGPAFYTGGAPVFYTLALHLMEVEIRTQQTWTGANTGNVSSANTAVGGAANVSPITSADGTGSASP